MSKWEQVRNTYIIQLSDIQIMLIGTEMLNTVGAKHEIALDAVGDNFQQVMVADKYWFIATLEK